MAFVQHVQNDVNATAQTVVSATLPSSVGANRVVIWAVFYISNTARTVTMSGGSSVTYTQSGTVTCTGGTTAQQYHFGYAKVPSSQSLTVTATLSGSGDYPAIYLMERDDLDYTTPAVANEDAGRRTNTASSGSSLTSGLTSTLTNTNNFVLGLSNNYSAGTPPAAGSGWTNHGVIWDYGSAGGEYGRVISKTVSSFNAVQSEFVSPNSNFFDILVVVYKLAPTVIPTQTSFRGYNDSGTSNAPAEPTLTAIAGENVNFSVNLNTNFITRFQINTVGAASTNTYKIQYQNTASPGWIDVPVGGGGGGSNGIVTYTAAGTYARGTTSCAPSYPTPITASTSILLCVVTGYSSTAANLPTMPSGWTKIIEQASSSGTFAIDSGPRRVTIFRKDTVTGSETGTVTVSLAGTTTNTLSATILCIDVQSGYTPEIATASGSDETFGNDYSVTSSSPLNLTTGDIIVTASALSNDQANSASDLNLFSSGATISSASYISALPVLHGYDHMSKIHYWSVTAGSANSTITLSEIVDNAATGATAFVRIRAAAPVNLVEIKTSTLIADNATSALLTAPSGKTTSNFSAGYIVDDQNALPSITIASGNYTEVAWCMQFNSALANSGQTYQFRVTNNGVALDSYTNTPTVTIGSSASSTGNFLFLLG